MAMTYFPGHVAERAPERPAVIMAGSGARMSYADLEAYANQLSHLLRDLGLQRGDHVAVMMENRLEYLPVLWGCHYAGLYYTSISTRLNSDEAAYIVNDCGARAIFCSQSLAEVAKGVASQTLNLEFRFSVGGAIPGHAPLEEVLGEHPPTPLPDRSEGSDMLYSSGTTGKPKGVKMPLPEGPFGGPTPMTMMGERFYGLTDGCVYLSPAPLYHGAPLRFCMAVQRLGGTVVVMEKFDAEAALASIATHRVTTSQWVPTMFVRILKLPENVRRSFDISSLKFAIHAAAPCPVDVKEQMIAWWGPILEEYYGGTEGAGSCYISSREWLEHRGSVGRPLRGSVHILGETGEELPVGQEGAVFFNSGAKFEYHNDPEKTAAAHTRQGWATYGDIGRVDADGYLYLTDRKAFMIISGGVNIYPQEAENVLTMHPAVHDVAVFGVPNPDFGEEVKAVVHPVSMPADAAAAAALERDLIAYCRARLADIKCPRTVEFRDDLPREPTGKLKKQQLKREYWQQATEGASV